MTDPESNNTKITVSDPISPTNTPIGEIWENGSEEISLKQIAFVRALNDPDSIVIKEDKEIILPCLATRTHGEIPRLTTHTAINHLVASHMWGNWASPEVIVIMPGVDTVKENGNPQNLRHQDSFWYKDLKVPKSSVLIWRDTTPEEFKDSGYENVEVRLDETTLKRLESLNANLEQAQTGEEKNKIDSQIYSLQHDLEKYFQEIVYQQLKRMNYSHLPNENGMYSNHKNLDHSIHNLSEKLGIKTSYPHSETASHMFEDLNLLKKHFINPEDIKPVTSEEIIQDLNIYNSMKDYTPLLGDDYYMLKIFIAELSDWISKNSKEVESNESIRIALRDFINTNQFIADLLKDFLSKDPILEKLI
jgi:hypothetical protein